EAVRGVADEAAVGEHDVVADLDPLLCCQHHIAVQKAPLADLDAGLGGHREPAAGLEQAALADPKAPLVERLEQLALDREADEEAAASRVPSKAQPPQRSPIPLVPAALYPPQPPAGKLGHGPSFPERPPLG